MSWAVALLALVSTAAPTTVVVEPPDRVALFVTLTDTLRPQLGALLDELSTALRRQARLDTERRPAAELRDCDESMSCLTKALAAARPPVRFAMLLSVTDVEDGGLLSVLLIDVGNASELAKRGLVADDLELAIVESASASSKKPVVVRRISDIVRHFQEALDGPYDSRLAGRETALGRVEVRIPTDAVNVELDDRPVATVGPGVLELERVAPGQHRLRLTRDGESAERPFELTARQTVRLEIDTDELVAATPPAIFWASGGVAAAGLAALLAGLVQNQLHDGRACLGAPACESRFLRVHEWGAPADAAIGAPTKGGPIALVPLGYSLLGAGVIAGGGAWLVDRADLWWMPVVAGIVAGAVGYGLSLGME